MCVCWYYRITLYGMINITFEKGKAIPLQAWTGPEAPTFQDSRNTKVASLSALRAGRIYFPGNIPGTHAC
jgi:hypothetical protein